MWRNKALDNSYNNSSNSSSNNNSRPVSSSRTSSARPGSSSSSRPHSRQRKAAKVSTLDNKRKRNDDNSDSNSEKNSDDGHNDSDNEENQHTLQHILYDVSCPLDDNLLLTLAATLGRCNPRDICYLPLFRLEELLAIVCRSQHHLLTENKVVDTFVAFTILCIYTTLSADIPEVFFVKWMLLLQHTICESLVILQNVPFYASTNSKNSEKNNSNNNNKDDNTANINSYKQRCVLSPLPLTLLYDPLLNVLEGDLYDAFSDALIYLRWLLKITLHINSNSNNSNDNHSTNSKNNNNKNSGKYNNSNNVNNNNNDGKIAECLQIVHIYCLSVISFAHCALTLATFDHPVFTNSSNNKEKQSRNSKNSSNNSCSTNVKVLKGVNGLTQRVSGVIDTLLLSLLTTTTKVKDMCNRLTHTNNSAYNSNNGNSSMVTLSMVFRQLQLEEKTPTTSSASHATSTYTEASTSTSSKASTLLSFESSVLFAQRVSQCVLHVLCDDFTLQVFVLGKRRFFKNIVHPETPLLVYKTQSLREMLQVQPAAKTSTSTATSTNHKKDNKVDNNSHQKVTSTSLDPTSTLSANPLSFVSQLDVSQETFHFFNDHPIPIVEASRTHEEVLEAEKLLQESLLAESEVARDREVQLATKHKEQREKQHREFLQHHHIHSNDNSNNGNSTKSRRVLRSREKNTNQANSTAKNVLEETIIDGATTSAAAVANNNNNNTQSTISGDLNNGSNVDQTIVKNLNKSNDNKNSINNRTTNSTNTTNNSLAAKKAVVDSWSVQWKRRVAHFLNMKKSHRAAFLLFDAFSLPFAVAHHHHQQQQQQTHRKQPAGNTSHNTNDVHRDQNNTNSVHSNSSSVLISGDCVAGAGYIFPVLYDVTNCHHNNNDYSNNWNKVNALWQEWRVSVLAHDYNPTLLVNPYSVHVHTNNNNSNDPTNNNNSSSSSSSSIGNSSGGTAGVSRSLTEQVRHYEALCLHLFYCHHASNNVDRSSNNTTTNNSNTQNSALTNNNSTNTNSNISASTSTTTTTSTPPITYRARIFDPCQLAFHVMQIVTDTLWLHSQGSGQGSGGQGGAQGSGGGLVRTREQRELALKLELKRSNLMINYSHTKSKKNINVHNDGDNNHVNGISNNKKEGLVLPVIPAKKQLNNTSTTKNIPNNKAEISKTKSSDNKNTNNNNTAVAISNNTKSTSNLKTLPSLTTSNTTSKTTSNTPSLSKSLDLGARLNQAKHVAQLESKLLALTTTPTTEDNNSNSNNNSFENNMGDNVISKNKFNPNLAGLICELLYYYQCHDPDVQNKDVDSEDALLREKYHLVESSESDDDSDNNYSDQDDDYRNNRSNKNTTNNKNTTSSKSTRKDKNNKTNPSNNNKPRHPQSLVWCRSVSQRYDVTTGQLLNNANNDMKKKQDKEKASRHNANNHNHNNSGSANTTGESVAGDANWIKHMTQVHLQQLHATSNNNSTTSTSNTANAAVTTTNGSFVASYYEDKSHPLYGLPLPPILSQTYAQHLQSQKQIETQITQTLEEELAETQMRLVTQNKLFKQRLLQKQRTQQLEELQATQLVQLDYDTRRQTQKAQKLLQESQNLEMKRQKEEEERIRIKDLLNMKAFQKQQQELRLQEELQMQSLLISFVSNQQENEENLKRLREEESMRQAEMKRAKLEEKKMALLRTDMMKLQEQKQKLQESIQKSEHRVRRGNFQWHNGRFGFYDHVRSEDKVPAYVYHADQQAYFDPLLNTWQYKKHRVPTDADIVTFEDEQRKAYDLVHGAGAYDLYWADLAFKMEVNEQGGYYDTDGQWQVAYGYYDPADNYNWVAYEGYYDEETGRFIKYAKVQGDLKFMV